MYMAYRYQHVTVSLYYLPRLTQQNVCHSNIKWTFADLLPCYYYAIKTNSRIIRSRRSQQPLQAKEGEWLNCKLISLHNLKLWTWPLCSVSFIPSKKLSLQESNQLIGIKMPTSVLSRNIWFLIPISRFSYQVPQSKASSSNEMKKSFY